MAARKGIAARVAKAWAALTNKQGSASMPRSASRMYHSARASRLTADWNPSNSSADSELVSSLTQLRTRARALIRDGAYAKRAQLVVVNNVIGTGIGMQSQVMTSRNKLNDRINDGIEAAWCEWSEADNCHTGGRLSFKHFERAAMAQVFAAGEVFIRKHYRKYGDSKVPFALELIEAERIADEWSSPSLHATTGNEVRMGVEVDSFFRPVAYFIRRRHPSEVLSIAKTPNHIERVTADQIVHLAVIDRWPQTRGEPWMHAVARTFNDMGGYTEAEINRARAQACTPGAIETPEDAESFGTKQEDGSVEMETEPGVYKRLNPGEKLVPGTVTAPNPALDPFMRYMLREVAAGVGVSYESLSRDYSQSNYSSSRLALLDDRDMWRFYQSWFICDFRHQIHKEWLQQAVYAAAIPELPIEQYALDPSKFEAVLFKPRGWSWIDPTKEVDAYKEAIKDGMTTLTDVIAQTAGGQDIEDILATRERELEMMRDRNLVFETSPEFYTADANKAAAEAKAAAKAAAKPPEPDPANPQTAPIDEPAPQRVLRIQR